MTNKQKKVVMAVTNDLVTDQRVHKIATSLTAEGFEVKVIGRLLPNSQSLPINVYKTHRIKMLFTKGMLFYAFFNIRLFFILLFSRADIFTSNDLDTLLGVYLAAKLRRKKIVYDSHEYFTEVPELESNKFAKKVWTGLEKFIFPRLKNVSTVCQSIADIYNEKYKVPVAVIRNVPIAKQTVDSFDKAQFAGKKIVIYQGAVNIGRGIELMIETVKLLDNVVFLIIGGGDSFDSITQLIEHEGLQDKVTLLGRLHYSELHKYTCMADCGMSLEEAIGLNYYYALPNKIFDYIHAQIPFIVSDLPEMRRIVETYSIGKIVVDRSPKSIAKDLDDILQNKPMISAFEKAKKELVWAKEQDKLIALYRNCI